MTTPQFVCTASAPLAGSLITSTVTFLNSSGVATDPTTTVVNVLMGGAVTHPSITHVSTGVFSCEIDTTGQSGIGEVEWIGTGAVQAIMAQAFNITPAPI